MKITGPFKFLKFIVQGPLSGMNLISTIFVAKSLLVNVSHPPKSQPPTKKSHSDIQ